MERNELDRKRPLYLTSVSPSSTDRNAHTSALLCRVARYFDSLPSSRRHEALDAACSGLAGIRQGWTKDECIAAPLALRTEADKSTLHTDNGMRQNEVVSVLTAMSKSRITLNLLFVLLSRFPNDRVLRRCCFVAVQLENDEVVMGDDPDDDYLFLEGSSHPVALPQSFQIARIFPPAFGRCLAVGMRNLLVDELEYRKGGALGDGCCAIDFGSMSQRALRQQGGGDRRLTVGLQQMSKFFAASTEYHLTLSLCLWLAVEQASLADCPARSRGLWRQVLREVESTIFSTAARESHQGMPTLAEVSLLWRTANHHADADGGGGESGKLKHGTVSAIQRDEKIKLICQAARCATRSLALVAPPAVVGSSQTHNKKTSGGRRLDVGELEPIEALFRTECFLPAIASNLIAKRLWTLASSGQLGGDNDEDDVRRRISQILVTEGERRNEVPLCTERLLQAALQQGSKDLQPLVLLVRELAASLAQLTKQLLQDQSSRENINGLATAAALLTRAFGDEVVASWLRLLLQLALSTTAALLSRSGTTVGGGGSMMNGLSTVASLDDKLNSKSTSSSSLLQPAMVDGAVFRDRESAFVSQLESLRQDAITSLRLLNPSFRTLSQLEADELEEICHQPSSSLSCDEEWYSIANVLSDVVALRWSVASIASFEERYKLQGRGRQTLTPVARQLFPRIALMSLPRLVEQRFLQLEQEFAKSEERSLNGCLDDGAGVGIMCDVDDVRATRLLMQVLVNAVLHGNPSLADFLMVCLSHLLHAVLRPVTSAEASRAELHVVVGESLANLVIGSIEMTERLSVKNLQVRNTGEPKDCATIADDEIVQCYAAIPPLVVATLAGSQTYPMRSPSAPGLLSYEGVAVFMKRMDEEGIHLDIDDGEDGQHGTTTAVSDAWNALLSIVS